MKIRPLQRTVQAELVEATPVELVTAAIQLVSERIGRVTGKELVANARGQTPPAFVFAVMALMTAVNTINIAVAAPIMAGLMLLASKNRS